MNPGSRPRMRTSSGMTAISGMSLPSAAASAAASAQSLQSVNTDFTLTGEGGDPASTEAESI